MKKYLTVFFTLCMACIALAGCKNSALAGKDPDNTLAHPGSAVEDETTIFDKIIAGTPIDSKESLFDITDNVSREGYTLVSGCPYGEREILTIYTGKEKSLAALYDVSNAREKTVIELEDTVLTENARVYYVSEEFSYIIDLTNKQIIYLYMKDKKSEKIALDFVPDSISVLGEGEQFFYTLKDDCNVYQYTSETGNRVSVFDAGDIASDICLEFVVPGSNTLIVKTESDNYSGYASLSLEYQELTPLESVSGKLLYSKDEYVYTSPDKESVIIIYNPMTPRLTKEFRLEEPAEINNLVLFSDTPYFLSGVDTKDGRLLRFYNTDEGIMENCLTLGDEYTIEGIEYFREMNSILIQTRDIMNACRILIWNTEIIDNVIE